jgi:hypothetical protein
MAMLQTVMRPSMLNGSAGPFNGVAGTACGPQSPMIANFDALCC